VTTTKTRTIQIKEFAGRVERLCDFFIGKVAEETGKNESEDLKVLEDLKEDAADIQFGRIQLTDVQPGTKAMEGLSDYMRGLAVASEEEN